MRRGGRKGKRVRPRSPKKLKPNAGAMIRSLQKGESEADAAAPPHVEFPATGSKYSISFTNLRDVDVKEIARALRAAPHVQKLQLKEDGIMRLEGLTELTAVIKTHPKLQTLDLSDNYIGAEGGKLIAQALKQNTSLVRLDLSDNFTGDHGCGAFASALAVNKTLLYLSLSGNQIGAKGVAALSEGIRVNSSLKMLSLVDNPLTDRGIEKLVSAMEGNYTLTRLPISPYRFKGEARLTELLTRNNARQGEAFAEAQHAHEKIPWRRGKLMVVGEGGVGKTACVRSLLTQPFDPEWKSTIGISTAETRTTAHGWAKMKHSHFALDLLHKLAVKALQSGQEEDDTEDDEEEEELEDAEEQQVVLSEQTAVHGEGRQKEQLTEDEKGETPELKVGEEDEEGAEMEIETVAGLSYTLNEHLLVTAKQEKLALSVWDYGGQSVFYTLHHLFLTNYGMYLVVFDGRSMEPLGTPIPSLDYLRFWLNSIFLHAPEAPVLLVGTFAEEIANLELVDTRVKDVIGGFDQVLTQAQGQLSFFPVDNKSGRGIKDLREMIEWSLSKQSYFNFQVSVVWMKALDALRRSKSSWLTWKTVVETTRPAGIASEEELREMLQLFHELGIVFYFTATEELRNVVVTDPQWLADSISKVIRDKDLHPFNAEKLHQSGLTEDAGTLLQQALVSRDLLEFLWEPSTVGFLLDLMRSLLLLSDWTFSTSAKAFLVPSMIKTSPPEKVYSNGEVVEFAFEFLPQGVFERVVCLCVEYSAGFEDTTQPKLFKDVCHVDLSRGVNIVLSCSREEGVIRAFSLQTAAGRLPRMLSILRTMMGKVRDEVMGGERFRYSLRLSSEEGIVGYDEAKELQMEPWFQASETEEESLFENRLNLFIL